MAIEVVDVKVPVSDPKTDPRPNARHVAHVAPDVQSWLRTLGPCGPGGCSSAEEVG